MTRLPVPQRRHIEMGAAMLTSLGTLIVVDVLALQGAADGGVPRPLAALLLELAILGVATAMGAWIHIRQPSRVALLGLGLVAVNWGLATSILLPASTLFVALALMGILVAAAGVLNRPIPIRADTSKAPKS